MKNKGNVLVIIIVLILFAFGLSIYLFLQNTTTTPNPTPIIKDETINWKTYTDAKNNYQFKYPPNFEVKKMLPNDGDYVTIQSNNDFQSVTIDTTFTKNESVSFRDYVTRQIVDDNSRLSETYAIVKDFQIDSKPAIVVSNNKISKDLSINTFIYLTPIRIMSVRLGPVFQGSEQKYIDIYYQILSTFKFL